MKSLGLDLYVLIIGCLCTFFLGSSPKYLAADPGPLVVFAAASTTNAVTDAAHLFSERGLGEIKTSFASSSTLAKQIERGAPAGVFISANPKWMDFLEQKGLIQSGTRFNFLGNRVVLIASLDSTLTIEIGPGFPLALLLGRDRLAMGDPEHVPAGIYGKQALQGLGVWESVSPRVAPTRDVRAALTLVERGETSMGIVYATDAAISKKVKVLGVFPESSHHPITYPVALISGNHNPLATAFLELLRSPEGASVFVRYGFTVR